MTYLLPQHLRPTKLSEAQSPSIVRQTGKYGASFLVAGADEQTMVIFLDGQYQFRAFRRSEASNWEGLEIESVELELDVEEAADLSSIGRAPGMMVRRDDVLTIVAVSDGPFRRAIDVPVLSKLDGSTGAAVGFPKWRAIVRVGDERRVVWECTVPVSPA